MLAVLLSCLLAYLHACLLTDLCTYWQYLALAVALIFAVPTTSACPLPGIVAIGGPNALFGRGVQQKTLDKPKRQAYGCQFVVATRQVTVYKFFVLMQSVILCAQLEYVQRATLLSRACMPKPKTL